MARPLRRRKPDRVSAMRALIGRARSSFPFSLPAAQLCAGPCRGCAKKLLEFIDLELWQWEQRLAAGEVPSFGDLAALGKCCRRVQAALAANGLLTLAPGAGENVAAG
ncbi:hypothetical protein [Microbulbifer sp. TYP-18]|uniref:hypothetical protein n=1 Tax=Microbulbifer sp. TYP-18 TaxID=3230024 RepID=UPI0034C69CBB